MAEKEKAVIVEAGAILDRERIIAKAEEILDEGYDGIVGLRRRWGHVSPYLFTNKDELKELELEPRYNLATFVRQLKDKWPDKRFGVVSRGCDERALDKLEELGVFNKEGLVFIGITCSMEQAEECNCEKPVYDVFQCTGCWKCIEKCEKEAVKRINVCPIVLPNEFDMKLSKRRAIYIPFPQAVPNKSTRNAEHCLKLTDKLDCKGCENVCEAEAIEHEMKDKYLELDIGAIIMATGYYTPDPAAYQIYGGGKYPDVITGLQLERLMSSFGPTGGEIVRPSDGTHPKTVVFIGCVGSRDEKTGNGYCSRVCCMYMAKHAIMLKEHDPEVQSYVFYPTVRGPGGKMFEEFLDRAQEEAGAIYLRGEITEVYQEDKKIMVCGRDLEKDEPVKIPADLVVLAVGMIPSIGAQDLARILNISYDERNFILEAHPKLRPVETATDGIFLAGTCLAPFDIPESVAQGGAAAAQVVTLFSHDTLSTEPTVAAVDSIKCVGCLLCADVCPFNAMESQVLRDGRTVAVVNESVCKGCGLCVSACRSQVVGLRGFSPQQVLAEVMALWQ